MASGESGIESKMAETSAAGEEKMANDDKDVKNGQAGNESKTSDPSDANKKEGGAVDDEEEEEDDGTSNVKMEEQALALGWTFGFNKNVTGGVHNLSDDSRNAIFYFSGHTGVIYDYVQRKQTLLQGHAAEITCCAVSEDKRWIVTADQGPDALIVIWDSYTGTPIKSLFNPHPNGVIDIDMSPDAMFLVTLGAPYNGKQQVSLWEWTVDHDGALYTAECPQIEVPVESEKESKFDKGYLDGSSKSPEETFTPFLNAIEFNAFDIREFVTTGTYHVTFWSWESKTLEHQTPALLEKADFGAKVGTFTQTVFLPGSKRAVSGTSEGNLVLWEAQHLNKGFIESESKTNIASDMIARSAIKVVKLNKSGGIPYLTMHNDLLVVCGEDESIRFYDLEFRIVAWYEDLDAGPVTSVSFSNSTSFHYVNTPVDDEADGPSDGMGAASPIPNGSSKKVSKYALADFVVSTSKALIVGVDAAIFDDPNPDNRHGSLLLQGFDGPITSLITHPSQPILIAISESGIMQAWNYQDKRLVMVKVLHSEDHPSCAAFSPDGNFIAIGFTNGLVELFRWGKVCDMGQIACFNVRPGVGYKILQFSCDSMFLGAADDSNCVQLFRFVPKDVDPAGDGFQGVDLMKVNLGKRKSEPGPGLEPCDGSDSRNGWTFIGRHGSHAKKITCLDFGKTVDGVGRFISIGEDGCLVEYDLEQSSVVDGVKLLRQPSRIEFGSCVPSCCLIQPATKGVREDLIITANTEFKIKCFNANNQTCRRTTLGPTYGGHLSKLILLDQSSGGSTLQYLAYCTNDKVIGMVKLPLDGNPNKTMGLIAHPCKISGFVASYDGKYLISAGDMALNVWSVHTNVLDSAGVAAAAQTIAGVPKSLVPYLPLIDGGHDGDLYEEIVDYFYYAQLRCQGEETTSPRRTVGCVPLTQVPNLMRALGFYPTEHQIENMCSEIRYSEFASSARTLDTVTLEQFIKLYINHRPVVGVSQDEISAAFQAIERAFNNSDVEWKTLMKLLESRGEQMPQKELESCLTMLMGSHHLSSLRPNTRISPEEFASSMLGFLPYNQIQDAPPNSSRSSKK